MAAIFVRTVIIYLFLSLSLKFMGKRQMGELEISELVSTLLISEVAALPVADPDIPLFNALIPVILIVCLEIIISYAKNKSSRLKKCVEGKPIFVVYKGVLNQKALTDNRISLNELLCELRMQGAGDIKNVNYAILEPNGKLSVFKNGGEAFAHTIIIDGEINEDELCYMKLDQNWVNSELDKLHTTQDEVFLLTIDENKKTYLIKKERI